jgi:hypothetical protein
LLLAGSHLFFLLRSSYLSRKLETNLDIGARRSARRRVGVGRVKERHPAVVANCRFRRLGWAGKGLHANA